MPKEGTPNEAACLAKFSVAWLVDGSKALLVSALTVGLAGLLVSLFFGCLNKSVSKGRNLGSMASQPVFSALVSSSLLVTSSVFGV